MAGEYLIGYSLAALVGLLLGLLGGGGSILALPIFVYIFGINPVLATVYSLFVVGISSLFGTLRCYRSKLIDYKSLLTFGSASFFSVFLTRRYIMGLIPDIIQFGGVELDKGRFVMIFFATIMFLAGVSMIRSGDKGGNTRKRQDGSTSNSSGDSQINIPLLQNPSIRIVLLIFQGLVDGVVTGIVGAGGGFLIVPILVLFNKMEVKLAIGTSLAIISLKTLIGFGSSLSTTNNIDYQFLLVFTAISILGILIGQKLSSKLDGRRLKILFGYFVVIFAIYISIKEIIFLNTI